MKRAAGMIFLAIAASALLSSHQRTPFPLLIDEAEATTIICNPQPTPHLIGWNRNRKGEKA